MRTDNYLFDVLLADKIESSDLFLSSTSGKKITYKELDELTARYANALIHCGLEPGDRVAVLLEKSFEPIILYLATIRAGGVFLPLNTAYVKTEVDYFLNDAKPKILLCDPAKKTQDKTFTTKHPMVVHTLDCKGKGTFHTLIETQRKEFNNISRSKNDLAAILYTSGTTGRSKGAMLSHENLASNAKTLAEIWQYKSTDVLLHALPVYHTHGLFVAINVTLCAGASICLLHKFDAEQINQLLPSATVLMGVPTFYTRLLNLTDFGRDSCAQMRLFISGSAPLLAEDHQRFENLTGHRILERYGMTETNMNTSNPLEGIRKAGSVGFPLPGVVLRIISENTQKECALNEVGMIQVKGPNVFSGYWKMPDKTAEDFTSDGFFITGDLGFRDEEGYISIVGREKDLIISGGLNVYPLDVELVLNECEGIVESAVIGLKDSDLGEKVVAVITTDENYSEIQVRNTIVDKLAGYKRPKSYFQIDELPRNTMGKVQKNLLRDSYN